MEIKNSMTKIRALEEQHKNTQSKSTYQKLFRERKNLKSIDRMQFFKKYLLYLKRKFWQKSPRALKLLAWM